VAHFSGLLSGDEYATEQTMVRSLIEEEIAGGRVHLGKFLDEWNRLLELTGQTKSE
jgi:hypothetical protein